MGAVLLCLLDGAQFDGDSKQEWMGASACDLGLLTGGELSATLPKLHSVYRNISSATTCDGSHSHSHSHPQYQYCSCFAAGPPRPHPVRPTENVTWSATSPAGASLREPYEKEDTLLAGDSAVNLLFASNLDPCPVAVPG